MSKKYSHLKLFLESRKLHIVGALLFLVIALYVYKQPVESNLIVTVTQTDKSIIVRAENKGKPSTEQIDFLLNGRTFFRAYSSSASGAMQGTEQINGLVTFMFDDGWQDVYSDSYPRLEKYSYPATIAVVQEYTNKKGALSKKQIHALINQGWDISSHTTSGTHLTGLTQKEVIASLFNSKKYFWRDIWGVDTLTYPSGEYNPAIEQEAKKLYKSARIYSSGFNDPSTSIYRLKVLSIEKDTTRDDVSFHLDQAEANKTWLIFAFHHVSETDFGEYTVSPQFLEDMLEYTEERKLDVVTLTHGLQVIYPSYSHINGSTATWEIPKNMLDTTVTIQAKINNELSNKPKIYKSGNDQWKILQ